MPETKLRTAAQVRRDFLDYFAKKHGHRVVPSAPVFPQDDPTLLFTNAGMNQFKDVFLGTGKRDYTRAVDTQKCIRVSGKHNDLEEVGRDTYHHTFFEMLGNWSFGDYFKREAITWAWDLLTNVWKLPKERLWATVFAGDEQLGLPADEEAERIWREETDIDPDHVLRFDKKDNFWEMGDTGPCGPCSEIHIDRGGPGADPTDGARRDVGVNAGNERFIELWNLVFMEFNRLDDGSLRSLPAKHVDTGMGFERILSVLQGKSSNYDTDLFTPIFRRIEALTGKTYGADSEPDVAFRVVADHTRALCSAIADGAIPSNTGRGYVLRRLVRRASRFARQQLDAPQPFLPEVASTVSEVLGGAFPEIPNRLEHVRHVLAAEEEAFGRTLDRGIARFEDLEKKVVRAGKKVLPGDEAYELYATYGFPADLVDLMARERGLSVDAAGWKQAEEKHREASKAEGKFKQLLSAEELEGLGETRSTYHEPGDASYRVEAKVVFFKPAASEDDDDVCVLDASPFYPEAGGQVGDSGKIEDDFLFRVTDTQRVGSVVVHKGRVERGQPAPGARAVATVDRDARERTRKNHTATHLLHKVLKELVGEHVNQQGSYVGPDRLRFDFSNPEGLAPEVLDEIEREVNARIFTNDSVATTVEDLDAAKARGVTALFGEKYDDRVRVVTVGDSMELCGGTHVAAAGDIGPFLILSERAIQAGVRRLEALTGPAAVEEIQRQRRLLQTSARSLKATFEEVPERIASLQRDVKEAKKKEKQSSAGDVKSAFDEVKKALAERSGVTSGAAVRPELDRRGIGDVGDRLKGALPDLAVVLFGRDGDKVPFLALCQGRAREAGLDASALAKGIAGFLGGGGGGRPESAQGQGLSAAKLEEARAWVEGELERALG